MLHTPEYDPPPLVRVSKLASTSSQGAQTQARGTGGITAAALLARGHHPASCPLLCHYPASCPVLGQWLVLTKPQPHCDLFSEGLLRTGSCNANMFICLECFLVCMKIEGGSNPKKVLFLFILFCVTFIALALSPRLTIRYLFCQHSGFYCYKCRDTQVWIVWKMKQYFPKLLKTFC